ncbi:hypothetical protein JAAARDRAFT_81467 [Jaapia argillacea MUCL 33604]|uniref:Uncharacterized protein n=1 Tax=Jaapia argillacea MUCL 33604 TaxID=933084 RepID=A0A067PBY4_9AGAM|nr:hypothetical protein JAAARDRAFT_81467 [Jaapia argillacea MUCL 33604]
MVVDINAQLHQIDTGITALRVEQETLQQRLTEVHRLSSELLRKRVELEAQVMPDDILLEVFKFFVHDCAGHRDPASFYHPILLTHVCSRWRILSLSCSHLWSRILMKGDMDNDPGRAAIAAFLGRARPVGRVLDIVFSPSRITCLESHTECSLMVQNLGLVSPCVDNWKKLALHTVRVDAMLTALATDLVVRSFASLRHLEMSIKIPNRHPFGRYQSSHIPSTPSDLEFLELDRISPIALPMFAFPKLRMLRVSFAHAKFGVPLSHLLKILVVAPNLETLLLANATPLLDAIHGVSKAVILPSLTRLEFRPTTPNDVFKFLVFLSTPALQSIHLNLGPRTKHAFTDIPDEPITYPAVTKLTLCYEGLCESTKLRNIKLTSLQELKVSYRSESPFSSPQMKYDHEAIFYYHPLMPRLTHLSLSGFILAAEETLAYMPSLVYLKIDGCLGGKVILERLKESSWTVDGVHRARYCPLLESMTFSDCVDIEFETLRDVVQMRQSRTGMGGSGGRGADAMRISDDMVDMCLPADTPRKVKKLKKIGLPLRLPASMASPQLIGVKTAKRILSVSISRCLNISSEQLDSLRELGVNKI